MLELKSVSAGYGKHRILQDLSVTFEKGRLTGIIGVNGCGKSTLLKTILGILPITDGEISLDGAPLESLSPKETARKLAYLSQDKLIPDMTVGQLVLHGRFPHLSYPRRYSKQDRDIAQAAMERTGISHLADKSMQTLSGGMRQTAYIAMALAQGTDYILLDEPTTHLDISHQLELMGLLRNLADRGKGIVAVMHDLPLAFTVCHEILFLDGEEVRLCTPRELIGDPRLEEVFGVSLDYLEDTDSYTYRYTL